MSVANKGTGSTSQPTNTGFGGSVNATGYNETYGEGDIYGGGGETKTALSNGSAAKALSTSPQSQSFISAAATALPSNPISNSNESSWLKNAAGYVGMGTKVAGIGKNVLNLAGYGKTIAGKGLGMVGRAGSALLTAYSAYKMATGEAKSQDYINAGIGAATYAANTYAAADALATGLAGASTSAAPSLGASVIGSVGSYAAPYYALAKAGGMAINAVTNNNPWMKETPLGLLGEILDEPLAVEDAIGRALARHGVGTEKMWEGLNNANPLEVGGWIKNTKEKAINIATGGVIGLSDFTSELGKEVGLNKLTTAILSGGLSLVGDVYSRMFGGGQTEGQVRDQQAREYADALQKFAQSNPNYAFKSSDVPFDFSNAYGKGLNDWESIEEARAFYKDKTPEEIQAASVLSDADINKMLRDGTFTKYISDMQTVRQGQAAKFIERMGIQSYG
jgi:hypothetical protein